MKRIIISTDKYTSFHKSKIQRTALKMLNLKLKVDMDNW